MMTRSCIQLSNHFIRNAWRYVNGPVKLPQCRCLHTSGARWLPKSEETELLKQLKAKILLSGPISVADYMKEVLTNPVAGYYMHRDVFGTKGDFITSPEISQIFGELLGIWCVHEWLQAGSPPEIQVVELGPGRGTLADDMLRVFSQFDIKTAVSLHLVEISPKLSEMQCQKLTGEAPSSEDDVDLSKQDAFTQMGSRGAFYKTAASKYGPHVYWHSQLPDVPRKLSFYIAHEFFDALPIHKFQKTDGKWREVLVDVDNTPDGEHHLRFVLANAETAASKLLLPDVLHEDEKREHIEICPDGGVMVQELANRITLEGGLALVGDYGHAGEKTDTFRAFREHKLHYPLDSPGSADLTADVDFKYLTQMVSDRAKVFGPITQEKFLHNMGIGHRLKALMERATSEQRKSLITGYDMITNPRKMGERFKFWAITRSHTHDNTPAGFKQIT